MLDNGRLQGNGHQPVRNNGERESGWIAGRVVSARLSLGRSFLHNLANICYLSDPGRGSNSPQPLRPCEPCGECLPWDTERTNPNSELLSCPGFFYAETCWNDRNGSSWVILGHDFWSWGMTRASRRTAIGSEHLSAGGVELWDLDLRLERRRPSLEGELKRVPFQGTWWWVYRGL